MEVLIAFGINWKLLAIQFINFGIAVFILYRYAYKPLVGVIEKRQELITRGVSDAQAAREERERIEKEKTQIILDARKRADEIVSDLKKRAEHEARAILREAQEKANAILAELRRKGEEEKAYILKQSEKEIAKMIVLGAEKILREKP
jgi:F-type H+-transporting ATPase subunit b